MNLESLRATTADFFARMPPILGALLIFIAGWLLAKAAKHLVPRILSALRFDRFSEKTGMTGFLKKGNVHHTPSRLAGYLAYWFIMILALSYTVAALDQTTAASLHAWIAQALPRALAAILIAVIGIVVVTFLANFTVTIARNAATRNPELLGRLIRYAGFTIVGTMALEQLGFGQTIISTMLFIVFAALAFGFALAVGLGCKDMARKLVEDMMRNVHERDRARRGTDLEG